MNQKEYSKYFEILGLSQDASLSEIKSTYKNLKKSYSGDKDIPDDIRKEALNQIEDARNKLSALFDKKENKASSQKGKTKSIQKEIQKSTPDIAVFSGQKLKHIREERNIRLEDIAHTTKIQAQTLRDIEDEKYEMLPPEVYVKGFVSSYAKCLSIDSKKVAAEYISRYQAWKKGHEKGQKKH